MRYREGLTPGTLGEPAGMEMLVFTAVLGLIIGIACTVLGWRGGYMWLRVWGAGLVLSSIAFLIYLLV